MDQKKAQKKNPNAVIAIGSIIQGETKHFEYVCQAVTHGIKDLNDKLIQTPLDADLTFSDDPLRMIRAIRFAAQLNFKIESSTRRYNC